MRFIKMMKQSKTAKIERRCNKRRRAVELKGFGGGGGREATEGNRAEQHRLVVVLTACSVCEQRRKRGGASRGVEKRRPGG